MRVLFYLPLITSWWFDDFVQHLIRCAAREAEVHVIAPRPWSLTGIDERELMMLADLPEIRWHILDGADHPSFRTAPQAPADLIDFVRAIDPAYTFCRSADVTTPGRFPGRVRYLMEADYPPVFPDGARHSERIMLKDARLFDHCLLPTLDEAQRKRLRDHVAPLWEAFQAWRDYPGDRASYLSEAGLPEDRRILAVPLDYDSPENFFAIHHLQPATGQFLAELAERIGEDCLLALTVHPTQPTDRTEAIERIAETFPEKMRIVRGPGEGSQLSSWLIRYSDGVILRDSKTVAAAAFHGKPILRRSLFRTGPWTKAYTRLLEFVEAVRRGTARAAALEDALVWFGFHHANDAFVPSDPGLTFKALLDRVDRPINPDRWEAALEQHGAAFASQRAVPA